MAISFVNESHAPGISGYVNSVTINVPSGVQENDLLFALVGGTRDSSPSGWTLIGSGSQGSSTGTVYLYWRIADSSEPANYTFTFDGVKYSKNHSIIAYRGVDTSDPIGNSDIKEDSSTAFNTGTISATSGQWLVSFATQYTFGDNNVRTWTVDTGTERADYGDAANSQENSSTCWFDSNGSVSTGNYNRTHTASSSSSVGTTGIVAINTGADNFVQNESDTLTLSDSAIPTLDSPVSFSSAYVVNVG